MKTTKEYIPHKDSLELLDRKLSYLLIYLNEKESYINSLVDFDRFDCEACDEFEDISTFFHKASLSVYQLMDVKNKLKDHILNKGGNQ